MVALLSLAPLALFLTPNQTFDVTAVKTEKAFAGRLGYTVTKTVTLKNGADEITVTLPSYHDAILPTPKSFKVGDKVTVDHGHLKNA